MKKITMFVLLVISCFLFSACAGSGGGYVTYRPSTPVGPVEILPPVQSPQANFNSPATSR